ncbi:MAG: cytochrome P460 family protein [Sphingobacteriales bacterium]|nr:cytochrome P460 family protein [Sphingobacteriales bacterium]
MKKMTRTCFSFSAICILFISFTGPGEQGTAIPYPEGFRHWVHIKTNLTGFRNQPQRKFDGFHQIYANEKAVEGYKTGHFPEGSVIVFDKHIADTSGGVIQPGARKFINIMYKSSEQFASTGGWGFEEFSGESRTEGRLDSQKQNNCFNSCHSGQQANDFVFSHFRE